MRKRIRDNAEGIKEYGIHARPGQYGRVFSFGKKRRKHNDGRKQNYDEGHSLQTGRYVWTAGKISTNVLPASPPAAYGKACSRTEILYVTTRATAAVISVFTWAARSSRPVMTTSTREPILWETS